MLHSLVDGVSSRLFLQGDGLLTAMGLLLLSFAGILVVTARRLHAAVTESLTLRFERLDLLRTLQDRSTALETANGALQAEIGERQRAEAALRQAQAELERRVQERTACPLPYWSG